MDKLLVLFLIALSTYNALGQQVQSNNNRLLPPIPLTRTTTVPVTTTTSTPDAASTTTGTTFTTQSPQFRQCISSCPTTPEYNPVCGTNNVTYTNLGRLLCAQGCGLNVTVFRAESQCSISTT